MTFRGVSYPICSNCGERMRIIRRGPHVDERGYFERQQFVCADCDFRVEQRVTTDGTVQEASNRSMTMDWTADSDDSEWL